MSKKSTVQLHLHTPLHDSASCPYLELTHQTPKTIHKIKQIGFSKNRINGVGLSNAITTFCAHLPCQISNFLLVVFSLLAKSSNVRLFSVLYHPGDDFAEDLLDEGREEPGEEVRDVQELELIVRRCCGRGRRVMLLRSRAGMRAMSAAVRPLRTREMVFILGKLLLGSYM